MDTQEYRSIHRRTDTYTGLQVHIHYTAGYRWINRVIGGYM